ADPGPAEPCPARPVPGHEDQARQDRPAVHPRRRLKGDHVTRRPHPLCVLLALVAAAGASFVPRSIAASNRAAPAPRAARSQARAAVSPVELVESVPIETSLGNPELRHAREVWLEMIRAARHSIDLEGFYLSTWPGEPLEPVLGALGDAARRGVMVRMLFDRGMAATYPQPLDSLALVPGFAVRKLD